MLSDQNKTWAPHVVCKQCVEHLRQWTKKDRKLLCFGIPMVWREPTRWRSGLSVRFAVGTLGVYSVLSHTKRLNSFVARRVLDIYSVVTATFFVSRLYVKSAAFC